MEGREELYAVHFLLPSLVWSAFPVGKNRYKLVLIFPCSPKKKHAMGICEITSNVPVFIKIFHIIRSVTSWQAGKAEVSWWQIVCMRLLFINSLDNSSVLQAGSSVSLSLAGSMWFSVNPVSFQNKQFSFPLKTSYCKENVVNSLWKLISQR